VKSMLVSPNNLDHVMKILQKRYGKPKYILDTIFQQVESLPSMKRHDKKGLINFADAVRNLTSTAVAFDCQPYLSNPRLLDNLVRKLSDFRSASWCHYGRLQGSDFPSLQEFSDWLEEIGDEVEFGYDPLEDSREVETKQIVPCSFTSKGGRVDSRVLDMKMGEDLDSESAPGASMLNIEHS
jgi:hypothetical protein